MTIFRTPPCFHPDHYPIIVQFWRILIGWLGYTDEYRRQLCKDYLAQGFDAFKVKVGQNLADDRHRLQLVRDEIGWDKKLVKRTKTFKFFKNV